MEQFQHNVVEVVSELNEDDRNMQVIQVDQDKASKQPEVNSMLEVDDFCGEDGENAMALKLAVQSVGN